MGTAQLIIRWALAAVFVVAAVGKLLDLDGSRRSLEQFGVSARVARFGGVALPFAELAVAAALLIRPTARWGAVAAVLLLAVFVAGIARALAQGKSPDCHCFGRIHSEPVGAATVIRNLVLAAAAAFIAIAGAGPSIDRGLGHLNATQLALVATSTAAIGLALAVAQLWSDRRRLGRALAQAAAATGPPGLPRGTLAPEFSLVPIRGNTRSLADLLLTGRPTVIVFVGSGCAACVDLFPSLGRWQRGLVDSLNLVVIFGGDRSEVEQLSAANDMTAVLAQEGNEAFELYAVRVTPSAVQIGVDGVIAGSLAEGAPAIEALIRSVLARCERTKPLPATGPGITVAVPVGSSEGQ